MPASPIKLQKIKQQIITIERPFGGWAAQKNIPGQGNSFPVEAPTPKDQPEQYSLSSFVNLYRANFEGHLAPGECFNFQLTDSGGKVNQLPVAATTLGTNFGILANNRVVTFTNQAVGQVNLWDTSGHGGHSAASANTNGDIVSNIDLTVSSNLGYVFYSWEDATDGDIGIITQAVTGGAFTQTAAWFSALGGGAALQAGVPKKLGFGTDGRLYCLNGQYIAMADWITGNNHFANATANAQKLNLGNGYVANSWCPFQNYMVVIGNKSADAYGTAQYTRTRVWFWDYASANPNFVFDLEDFNGLRVWVDTSGNLNAITAGKDGMTTKWIYNGSTFVQQFQASTASIGSPLHNQLDLYNGNTHFMGSNSVNQWDGTGFHNALGSVVVNNSPNPVLAFGFLKNIDTLYTGIQLTSNQTGYSSAYGIWSLVNIAADTTYALNAKFYDQLRVLGYHGRAVAMRLYFSQFGTGAGFKASFFQGYDTATDLLNRTITYSSGNNYNVVTIPMNIVLDSFWTLFTWTHTSPTAIAAVLRKAEIVVEPTDFKL